MNEKDLSWFERLFERAVGALRANALPFGSALAAGLLAHMFAFTNLMPNYDGLLYFFGKGGTADSGRWGLDLLSLIFPDFHMPWLYGSISLLLMAAAACIIVRLFEIRRPMAQALLPALLVVFPSQTAIFCFIFTSSCYAVSFLSAVLTVALTRQGGWKNLLFAVLLLLFSLGIYQGFITVAGSLLLLLVVKDILDGQTAAGEILRRGLRYLLVLLAGMALYYVSIRLSLRLTGTELNFYSNDAVWMGPGLARGLYLAYYWFVYNLISRYNLLVISKFQRLLYAVCLLLAGAGLVWSQVKAKNWKNSLLLLLCLALLPLSVGCLYVIVGDWTVHTIVLFGYASLYVLAFMALEQLPERVKKSGRGLALLLFTVIAAMNIGYANRTYLKLDLKYENAFSQSTVLLSQIRSLPGFRSDMKLAIYRYLDQDTGICPPEFGDPAEDLVGVKEPLLKSALSEENFLRYFLGAEMETADDAVTEALAHDSRTADMPCYPDEGSIRILDDVVFVKYRPAEEG